MARKKYKNTTTDGNIDDTTENTSSGTSINVNTIMLGVILLLLIVQTFMMMNDDNDDVPVAATNTSQPAINTDPSQQMPTNQPQMNAADNPILNPTATASGATASYSESEKDFGSISAGKTVKHTFKVTNTGTAALSYGDITGDDGLTILSTPIGDIPPGGTGEITVQMNTAGMSGPINKNVHVNSNAQPAHMHLVMKGNVN